MNEQTNPVVQEQKGLEIPEHLRNRKDANRPEGNEATENKEANKQRGENPNKVPF